jgi:hypothetical protein
MEAKLRNSLYKIELHWIKIIPMVLSFTTFLDTILSYLEVEGTILAYINALLVWLFLYLSSFVFQFCRWHRMFLYYVLLEGIINWYDYTYGIPLNLRPMVAIQLCLIVIFISIGLYFYQHDKHPCKEDCSKTNARIC